MYWMGLCLCVYLHNPPRINLRREGGVGPDPPFMFLGNWMFPVNTSPQWLMLALSSTHCLTQRLKKSTILSRATACDLLRFPLMWHPSSDRVCFYGSKQKSQRKRSSNSVRGDVWGFIWEELICFSMVLSILLLKTEQQQKTKLWLCSLRLRGDVCSCPLSYHPTLPTVLSSRGSRNHRYFLMSFPCMPVVCSSSSCVFSPPENEDHHRPSDPSATNTILSNEAGFSLSIVG